MENKYINIVLSILITAVFVAGACIFIFGILPKQKEQENIKKLIAQYYADKVNAFEEENQTISDTIDIVFLGDSLTDGYNLSTYYPQFKTLNRGIGGDTTFGLENRLQISVYDVQPKVAVMLIGGNNLQTMFNNYENILQGFKNNIPSTKIVLLSLSPMGKNFANKNQIATYNNARIKALAIKYEYAFVDIFTPLFDVDTNEIAQDYTVEGVHFTTQGYEVITNTITPILTDLVNG